MYRNFIGYYGGKLSMLNILLPLIPRHDLYVEGFVGGGAVFWNRPGNADSVVNDRNNFVANFYRCVKHRLPELVDMLDDVLYSRIEYDVFFEFFKSKEKDGSYLTDDLEPDVYAAAALFCLCNMSFAHGIRTFAYSRIDSIKRVQAFRLKIEKLKATRDRIIREFERVTVERSDCLKLIDRYDFPGAFFYLDPPYVGYTYGTTYGDYSQADFDALLERLSTLKGAFILSCFCNESAIRASEEYGWDLWTHDLPACASNVLSEGMRERKIEFVIRNKKGGLRQSNIFDLIKHGNEENEEGRLALLGEGQEV